MSKITKLSKMASHRLCILLGVTWCLILRSEAASKYYTEENRPYDFGFTVKDEEQKQQTQHRHETKDENGIIMGEFGFLTADGVYHVTVYATDENGNFKILSMKNLRTKPFSVPTANEKKSPQAKSIPFLKSPTPEHRVTQEPKKMSDLRPQVLQNHHDPRPIPVAAPVRSCSSCSIPTSPKPQLTDLAVVSRTDQFSPYSEQPNNTSARQFVSRENLLQRHRYGQGQQNFGAGQQNLGQGQNNPSSQSHNEFGNVPTGLQLGQQPKDLIKRPGPFGQPGQPENPRSFGQSREQRGQGLLGINPGQQQFGQQPGPFSQTLGQKGGLSKLNAPNYPEYSQEIVSPGSKPKLISAQIQIVDKNTDVNKLSPGEKPGLPNGLKEDNMLQIFYVFNYTLGFHSHFEEGYSNGVKKGYYYVTGRNGVRTRIDYVADSNGFHPKISTEVLDLLSEDVPKPETEKENKYGLKRYEFKWLYFPRNSR